jgi:hypothetical protein
VDGFPFSSGEYCLREGKQNIRRLFIFPPHRLVTDEMLFGVTFSCVCILSLAHAPSGLPFSPGHATHVRAIARIPVCAELWRKRKRKKNFQRQHVFAWKHFLYLFIFPFSFLPGYGLCQLAKTRSSVCQTRMTRNRETRCPEMRRIV